ncbi:GtrA family protein [Virgibacillus litoralis]|uniref:Flippase GtrA n=1 Tax=Virgibacillus litoralis TaxID=578221 RepID=A0ABS4HJA6_9BACI|nr:putative flippase GtrA [Virgibacillus litoralis]
MNVIRLEFIRFIIVGIINTLNYYGIYLIFNLVLGINYMASHIIGFAISLIVSFFLSSYFTFQVKPSLKKFLQFPLTQLFNISVSSVLIYLFVEYFFIDSTIAPIVSLFITVPLTFLITGKILKK